MQLEAERQNQRTKILHTRRCKFLQFFSGYFKKRALRFVFVADFEVLGLRERQIGLRERQFLGNVRFNPFLFFAAQKPHNKTNL